MYFAWQATHASYSSAPVSKTRVLSCAAAASRARIAAALIAFESVIHSSRLTARPSIMSRFAASASTVA